MKNSHQKNSKQKIKFNIITLFPDLFKPHLDVLPLSKAKGIGVVEINLVNLRDYAIDKRGTVDDSPYGGGVGMILMVEPIHKALIDIHSSSLGENASQDTKIILLSPRGRKYNQKMANQFLKAKEITLICGRYEGIDARVENYCTDMVSIGDYVLSGGELPALAVMESVARLLPGILEKEEALVEESFDEGKVEYPQYTRPEEYNGFKVPKVLLSGNHKEIRKWKIENKKVL